jgi:2-methylcitrate dehydratase PrpD
MQGGEVVEKQVDDMSGSVRMPLSARQEEDKFLSLAGSACDDQERIRRCMEEILRIDSLDRLPDLA